MSSTCHGTSAPSHVCGAHLAKPAPKPPSFHCWTREESRVGTQAGLSQSLFIEQKGWGLLGPHGELAHGSPLHSGISLGCPPLGQRGTPTHQAVGDILLENAFIS